MRNTTRIVNRDLVYNDILDKIQYCEWTPGMPISEAMLSELFQVSRTPVREALFCSHKMVLWTFSPRSAALSPKSTLSGFGRSSISATMWKPPILTELAVKKNTHSRESGEALAVRGVFGQKREVGGLCAAGLFHSRGAVYSGQSPGDLESDSSRAASLHQNPLF